MEEACNVLLEFIYEENETATPSDDSAATDAKLLTVVTPNEDISMVVAPKASYQSRGSPFHLTCSNVAVFSDEAPIFSRLSMDLQPGQRAFILCATRQQKKSVLDVLSFIAPHSSGSIAIDESQVSYALDGELIRREVALCMPENFTFSGSSVADNVRQCFQSTPSLQELCALAGIDSNLGDLNEFGESVMPDAIPPCMSLIAQLLRLLVRPSRFVVVDADVITRSNAYHRAVSPPSWVSI
jgi:ABC-type multidrug transport system fused ATPase/permease subunit